jgi:hypothetical protein
MNLSVQVTRGIGTPKDRDEVNKREVNKREVCEGLGTKRVVEWDIGPRNVLL